MLKCVLRRWLAVLLIGLIAATANVSGDVATASERSEVEIACGRKTPPAFDCTCVGDRYDRLIKQHPDRKWTSLQPELFSPDCYSSAQMQKYFAVTDCAMWNRKAERIRKRFVGREIPSGLRVRATVVDCECYASNMTRDILTLKVILVRNIAAFRIDAVRDCPAN